MKRIKFVFPILLMLTASCSEDFLKPKPKSFFAPENVFVNAQGFESLLITMRKNLVGEVSGYKHFISHQVAASENGSPLLQLDFNNLTPSSDKYQQFVNQINTIFVYVKDANVAIARIDDIKWESEAARNKVLAEAYWHRAYWYYRLVHNYGDLPFVETEVSGPRLDFNSHSRWAILKKIKKDTEFAVTYLPDVAVPGAISKAAGNHLLTKIALADMDFDLAITASTRVINDGTHALMTTRFGEDAGKSFRNLLWDLHRPNNKNLAQNKETILAIVDRFESPQGAKTLGSFSMRHYAASWWHTSNRDSKGGVGFIKPSPMADTLGNGNPDVAASDWHMYTIWSEFGKNWKTTTDLRRADINWIDKHEIVYNNPTSSNYGQPWQGRWMSNPSDSVYTMFAWPHYKVFNPQQNAADLPNGGNGDQYIFRLAETYLLRAEAYFWKNDLASAAEDINKVRARAKAQLITASDVTIDYIFDERARELYAEEPRQNELNRVSYIMASKGLKGYSLATIHQKNFYYDRVRNLNNLYSITPAPIILGVSPKISPHHFQWPIDDKIINANTLGTINQSPGYTGWERNKPPLETIE